MVAEKSRRGQVVQSSSKFQGPVEPDSWTVLRVWTRDVLGCKLRKTGARSLSGQCYSSNPCKRMERSAGQFDRAWCWDGLRNQGSLACGGARWARPVLASAGK